MTYGLAGIPNVSFPNQTLQMGPSYTNNGLAYCYGAPYAIPTFIPAAMPSDVNGDLPVDGSLGPANSSLNEAETNPGESQNDENNDSGNKSDSSSSELKPTPTLSSHDSSANSQQMIAHEHDEEKHRTSISVRYEASLHTSHAFRSSRVLDHVGKSATCV